MEARMIDVGQVRLHVITADPARDATPRGPVVLLHGFPSFWRTWRHQIEPLAAAGFTVIAPDLRGYNLSDKPRGVEAYTVDRLSGDVLGLLHALGHERATIVGHDWGGAVAWNLAMRYPRAVERLVIVNAPHPAIMREKLFTPERIWTWWYMFAFQIPWIPEMVLRQPRRLVGAIRGCCAVASAFDRDDLRAHVEAFRQPGAATAAINYYRAAFRHPQPAASLRRLVEAPTRIVWGERDPLMGDDLLDGIEAVGRDVHVQRVDAGHWVPLEAPHAMTQAILTFGSPQ